MSLMEAPMKGMEDKVFNRWMLVIIAGSVLIVALVLVGVFVVPPMLQASQNASAAVSKAASKAGTNIKESANKAVSGGNAADAQKFLEAELDKNISHSDTYTLELISNSEALSKINMDSPDGVALANLINDKTKTVWFFVEHVKFDNGGTRDYPEPVWQENSKPGIYHCD